MPRVKPQACMVLEGGSSQSFFESLPSVGRECCVYCLQLPWRTPHSVRPGSCSSPDRGSSRLPEGRHWALVLRSDSAASRLQSPGRGKEEGAEGGEEKPEPHTRCCFGAAPLTAPAKHLCADRGGSL